MLSFRTRDQAGNPGIRPGYLIVAYDTPQNHPNLLLHLGTDVERLLTAVERDAFRTTIGATISPTSNLVDAVGELLFNSINSDPTGLTKHKPVGCGRETGVHIELAGIKPRGKNFFIEEPYSESHPAALNAREVFKADYSRLRDGVALGRHDLASLQRMVGDKMLRMFGRMGDDLLPGLLPPQYVMEGWARPATSVEDNFDRADSTTLGSAWVEVVTNLQIFNKRLFSARDDPSNTVTFARFNSDLSSANHETQGNFHMETNTDIGGPAVRCSSDASPNHDFYGGGHAQFASQDQIVMVQNGTLSNLQTNAQTRAGGVVTAKLKQDSADLLTCDVAGNVITVTDSTITGNLQGGFFAKNNDGNKYCEGINEGAKWQCDDLAVVGGFAHSQAVIVG